MSPSDEITRLVVIQKRVTFNMFACTHLEPQKPRKLTAEQHQHHQHTGYFQVELANPFVACAYCKHHLSNPDKLTLAHLIVHSKENSSVGTEHCRCTERATFSQIDLYYLQGIFAGREAQGKEKENLHEVVYQSYYSNAEFERMNTVERLKRYCRRNPREDRSEDLETHIRRFALKAELRFAIEAGNFLGRRWFDRLKDVPAVIPATTPSAAQDAQPEEFVEFSSLRDLYPEKYKAAHLTFSRARKVQASSPTVIDLTDD